MRGVRNICAAAAVVATLGSGVFLMASPAGAAVVDNRMVDVDTTSVVGGCIADTIHTEGVVHVLSRSTTDGSGGLHVELKYQTIVLKGVGLTGTEYITNGNNPGVIPFQDVTTEDTNGATVRTVRASANIISLGSGINLRSTLTSVVVLRPDGTIAHIEPLTIDIHCQG